MTDTHTELAAGMAIEIAKAVNIKSIETELALELAIGLKNNESSDELIQRAESVIDSETSHRLAILRDEDLQMKSLEIEDDFEREIYKEMNQSSKEILSLIKETYKRAKDGKQNLIQ